MPLDVGGGLKAARMARGMSVPELASATRIRAELIEAIERNDFARCGGDVFARGHVRAIATTLGLDGGAYVEAMGGTTADTSREAVEPESVNIWELRDRAIVPSERHVWAIFAVVGVLIVAALIYMARHSASASQDTLDAADIPSVTSTGTATVTAEPTPLETSPTPTPSAADVASDATSAPTPPQETTNVVSDGALVIQLDCTQTSWVRITNTQGLLYEGTLRAGDQKVLSSDTDVTVRIGNAGGVGLVVNDVAYAHLGAVGEVYTHTFAAG